MLNEAYSRRLRIKNDLRDFRRVMRVFLHISSNSIPGTSYRDREREERERENEREERKRDKVK